MVAQSRNKETLRANLYDMSRDILLSAPHFNFDLGLNILGWAAYVNKAEGKADDELFSDPLLLMKTLVDLFGADTETLYASIIYPAVRPRGSAHFNRAYLEEVSHLFRDGDGIAAEQYSTVEKLTRIALQVRALNLIATPHGLKLGEGKEKFEAAFDKPSAEELDNLINYFTMSIKTAEDVRGAAIRITQWYLRLQDMRLRPEYYSDEDRLHAYYYTDKFYAPYCEFLASQRIKDDPKYTPQNENKGFYRLKVALEEELMLQIAPEQHAALKEQLLQILKGFNVIKPENKDKTALELFDDMRAAIEKNMNGYIKVAGIPKKYVKFETRMKGIRSYYQKVRAKRNDIFDQVGFRIVVDIERWNKDRGVVAKHFASSTNPRDQHPNGNRIKKQIEEFGLHIVRKLADIAVASTPDGEEVNRHRDLWKEPYDPDNGFRSINVTLRLFGGFMEGQFYPRANEIINSTGSAAHPLHKFMGNKKGEKHINKSTAAAWKQFAQAADLIVVRTAKKYFVLKKGADTVAHLGKKIHSARANEHVAYAIVDNHDPFDAYTRQRVGPDYRLKNGESVHVVYARTAGLQNAGMH